MTDSPTPTSAEKNVKVVRGQHHNFQLIPIMDRNAEFFPAGPVTFGVEGRALGTPGVNIGERGASLHVFNADRSEEWLRFDCFGKGPHYHYILHPKRQNIVWGYDSNANGPMLPWVMRTIRNELPRMLRAAGAVNLAEQVETRGLDELVLQKVEHAMIEADRQTLPGTPGLDDRMREGMAWMYEWKKIHPQFNTVDDGDG
jgi:hypothetical protein